VSPWKVILATMVIFACGVVTGAILTKTMVGKAPEHPQASSNGPSRPMAVGPVMQMQRAEFFKRMDKQLELSAGQRDQISKILKASQARTQPLWDQISPQMNDELRRVREEIRGVLSPEQWKEFGDMMRGKRKPDATQPTNAHPSFPAEPAAALTNAS
jgi:Spy/CpxP family protein refolding chaperone